VRIEKRYDVRMCVIDREILAVAMQRSDGALDVRRDNMEGVAYRPVAPPARTSRAARRLVSSYGLRFAALDFVVDPAGTWYFLELNPNGQWAWLDLVGGADFAGQFCRALSMSRKLRRNGG
jgi:glutathione synthase/RimK-type ligase-like ATP-grasp enzyme